MKKTIVAALFALLGAAPVTYAQSVSERLGRDGLQATYAHLKANEPDNNFAIGMIGTLAAVETTMQTRWRYNIGDGVLNMPLMRSPIGINPEADAKRPELFSAIMRQFLDDMTDVQTALKTATGDENVTLLLRPADLWFDIDADGVRDDSESALVSLGTLFAQSFNQNIDRGALAQVEIRFDNADTHWLLAYTHLLSGVANSVLAFDPTPVFERLDAEVNALNNAPTRAPLMSIPEAEAKLAELQDQQKELRNVKPARLTSDERTEQRKLRADLRQMDRAADPTKFDAAQTRLDQLVAKDTAANDARRANNLQQQAVRAQIADVYAKSYLPNPRHSLRSIESLGDFKPFYVLIEALAQHPDPDHLQKALINFREMIAQNRDFWAKLTAETDNDREWIANDAQDAALGFETPDGAADQWQVILAEIEAMLNGELLVQHPLLPEHYGINIPAFVANPSPLTIQGLVAGVPFYPYVEKGPRLSSVNWQRFNRIVGGHATLFAILYN